MRDPHIRALYYRAEAPAESGVQYDSPASLSFETDSYEGTLSGGTLKLVPKVHFATRAEARAEIEPYLTAWEISSGLEHGRSQIRFTFDRAEVVDRIPSPEGVVEGHLEVTLDDVRASLTATCILHKAAYPNPPSAFKATPVVEAIWNRYQRYLDDREPFLSMAYACLTAVEDEGEIAGSGKGGRRDKAARLFGIDPQVLSKIGELASERAHEGIARKHKGAKTPLTEQERVWLEKALREVIRQVGEHGSGATGRKLTMADLPPL